MLSIAKKKKKTVKFSPNANYAAMLPTVMTCRHTPLGSHPTNFINEEASPKLILHYIKTRPRKPKAPSNRSGIVYNCHPAHYEIMGESLRGMEHYTDISQACRRERLRSDAIKLVACMYRETAKEKMFVYSRKIAMSRKLEKHKRKIDKG